MATFGKSERQRVIDGYLAATGRNMFNAAEFIDWLAGQPDHDAYSWFYGKDDATAARDWRIQMARQMANGLRIVANVSTMPQKGNVVSVTVREFPAFVSPMSGRKVGGGYTPFDPKDAAAMAELRRQGATAMRAWLARYRGAFEGVDLTQLEKIGSPAGESVALSA